MNTFLFLSTAVLCVTSIGLAISSYRLIIKTREILALREAKEKSVEMVTDELLRKISWTDILQTQLEMKSMDKFLHEKVSKVLSENQQFVLQTSNAPVDEPAVFATRKTRLTVVPPLEKLAS